MINNTIQILDTTLRDGSYVIDFEFTAEDTKVLTHCLDVIGIKLIEIGHGLGINAGTSEGRSAMIDVDHIHAAKSVSKNSKIGMFCIPGIATNETLIKCIDAGLDFVRIGVNVDEIAKSEMFIKLARQKGVFVCSNFMKSYVMKPDDYSQIVKQSEDYGSQMIYVVDSAGGMLPNEVKEYVSCSREVSSVPIGFHGHNNIGLAVANSLAAIEAGVAVVDTTLLGIGRSSGNVPTEVMLPLLQRLFGACLGIDQDLVLEVAETLIAPLLKNRWDSSRKTALGLARVHSMYADQIAAAAKERGKLYFSVIREVGRRSCLNLPINVLRDSVSAAKGDDIFFKTFGDISLIEKLTSGSSFCEIRRTALKLNIPVLLMISDRREINLNYQSRQIFYEVQPDVAVEFLQTKPECIVCVRVETNILNRHSRLKAIIQDLDLEYI